MRDRPKLPDRQVDSSSGPTTRPARLLTRSVSEGLFPFCRKDLRQSSLTLRVSVERNRRCQGRDAVNPRPWDDPRDDDGCIRATEIIRLLCCNSPVTED